jgi:hypothetical protein
MEEEVTDKHGQEELPKLQREQTPAAERTPRKVNCLTFIVFLLLFGPLACLAIALALGLLSTLG